MTRYLAIAIGVLVVLLGVSGWLLKRSYEENGRLSHANAELTKRLEEKDHARKERERTDSDIRKLPPADVIDRLR